VTISPAFYWTQAEKNMAASSSGFRLFVLEAGNPRRGEEEEASGID